jgi:acyl-CoA thioesterase
MPQEPEAFADLVRDTAVEVNDGRYNATISPDWCVWSPQGGYLMALALRAGGRATAFPKPLSFACHFLAAPKVGAVQAQVTVLRKTRVAESLRISLLQDDRLFLEAMLWAGDTVPGYVHTGASMPDVPSFETLAAAPSATPMNGMHTLWRNIEQRPCGPLAWARTAPAEPRQRDWMRLRSFANSGDAFIEAGRYALFLDTFSWPAAAHAHVGDRPFIAPTLSFAIDFHAFCDSEWLLSDAHSPTAGDGRLAIHDRVWSPSGELLASATGTMLCRPRPGA